MKKYLLIGTGLLLLAGTNVLAQTDSKPIPKVSLTYMTRSITYNNPLPVAISDPYVIMDKDSTYYMYGTNGGGPGSVPSTMAYPCYSSKDLVNWRYEGKVLNVDKANNPWCINTFWAPCVRRIRDKYYMFYSAQWGDNPTSEKENYRVGVAVADKPTGPFVNVQNRPIFNPGYPIIDADVFIDDNGRYFLYYSRCCYKHSVESELATWAKNKGWFNEIEESWVYGVELKPDFSGVIGEPVVILRPPVKMNDPQAEWESRSVTSHDVNRRWTEGSFTFKHGDTYYIMYSANSCVGQYYALGYATAKSPLGPFIKAANNPVVQEKFDGRVVVATGHNCVVTSPDGKKMFCIYHGHTKETGRVLFVDRMEIKENGELVVHGPTTDAQPLPLSK